MRLGHVAAVRKIIDKRTLLISHANWSTIDGVRGHIEDDVMVVDASEANDWSRVRVWYTPNQALGGTEWPLHGFIYPQKQRSWGEARKAVVSLLGYQPASAITVAPTPVKPTPKAVVASRPKAAFSLSPSLLAEIEKGAAKDRKGRKAKS
jgi:hypothetical protein